jgi:hypothetical protein
MAKQIVYSDDARKHIKAGVDKLANAVKADFELLLLQ